MSKFACIFEPSEKFLWLGNICQIELAHELGIDVHARLLDVVSKKVMDCLDEWPYRDLVGAVDKIYTNNSEFVGRAKVYKLEGL